MPNGNKKMPYYIARIKAKVVRWMETVDSMADGYPSHASWFMIKSPIEIQVYIRKTVRHLDQAKVTSLDIANLVLYPTGQGHGTKLIDMLHDINPCQVTYIESVVNERFAGYLERSGWLKAQTTPPSFYKIKDDSLCQVNTSSNADPK